MKHERPMFLQHMTIFFVALRNHLQYTPRIAATSCSSVHHKTYTSFQHVKNTIATLEIHEKLSFCWSTDLASLSSPATNPIHPSPVGAGVHSHMYFISTLLMYVIIICSLLICTYIPANVKTHKIRGMAKIFYFMRNVLVR